MRSRSSRVFSNDTRSYKNRLVFADFVALRRASHMPLKLEAGFIYISFATHAKRVTDEMFIEAGEGVADQVPNEVLKRGLVYPLQSNVLETEIKAPALVAKVVFDSGLPRVDRPVDKKAFIRGQVYKPEYPPALPRRTKSFDTTASGVRRGSAGGYSGL
jgi:hypothetical protein